MNYKKKDSSFCNAPIKRRRSSASRNTVWVVLCLLCMVIGCRTVGKSISGGSAESNGNHLPKGAAPVSSPVEQALQVTPPRTLKYANLQYTVTKAVISDRLSDVLPVDNSKPAVADVTFSVVNNSKEGVSIRSGLWELKLSDGSVYKSPYEDNLNERDTQERRISFHVPETAQWSGAQITLDEQGKEPATIQLDGNITPSQYPHPIGLKNEEETTKDPAITYAIQSASVDLDGLEDRALLGKRYLNLTAHVSCVYSGSEFLPDYFRLLTNGAPSRPEKTSDNGVLDCPGSQDYVMSYVVPANSGVVELEVGRPDVQQTLSIPIDLAQ